MDLALKTILRKTVKTPAEIYADAQNDLCRRMTNGFTGPAAYDAVIDARGFQLSEAQTKELFRTMRSWEEE